MTSPDVAIAGAVALDVEPDARDFYPRLRAQVLPAADAVGRDIGRQMAAPVVTQMTGAARDGVQAGGRPAQAAAVRTGQDIGAALGRSLRTRVEAALANMPDVEIDADSSALDRKVAAIRAQLVELRDQNIDIDVADEEALGRIQVLRQQLSTLAREVERVREAGGEIPLHVDAIAAGAQITRLKTEIQGLQREAAALARTDANVRVTADTTAAQTGLTTVAATARAVGAQDVEIDVDVNTQGAMANLAAMGAASVASAGGIQVLLSVAALIGPVIVPAAAAAAAGLAAIGPAAIAGVAGIGVLVLAFSGVLGAVQALNQAQGQAGRSAASLAGQQARIASAASQVESAERSLANTRANAADQVRRSAEQVRQAVDQLRDAEEAAARARADLTRAQEDARRAQEDLASAVANGALAQRGALLNLEEARARLDDVLADPTATDLERERAQLNYDQAVQQVEDLRIRQERLTAEQEAANRAGIEGSEQVRAARERIAEADERVAAAQRAVAEARANQATQERQAAFSIAQAQQAVINAQRSMAQAHQQTGAAGVAAVDRVKEALSGLSPAGREFALFLVGLRDEFRLVRQAAEAGLLPGVQEGIEAFLPVLPLVILFVSRVSTAIGDLFARAGAALTAPFWVDFFDLLGRFAGPAFQTFGDIIGGLARGFASLMVAFMPLSQQMGDGLADMADSFAEWAAGLAGSEGFESFIDYVIETGPDVLALIGNLILFAIRLGIVFAPLGAIILDIANATLSWLAALDPSWLALIVGGIGAIGAALALAAGGPLALIVAGVVALVAAVVFAWNRFEGFRQVVTTALDAVGVAAVWLWQTILMPTFTAIAAAIAAVAAVVTWLWVEVWMPAFNAIAAVVMWWWTNVTEPVFNAVSAVITNFVMPVIMALWRSVVVPAFQGIQLAISIAWAAVQVIFGLWQIAFRAVGAVASWLWRNAIEPAFRGIASVVSFVWESLIRPVFEAFGGFIETWVAPAFRRGVSAIETAWRAVQDVAKVPVRFVVQTVLNQGLLAAYNKIASMFGVKPDNVQIPLPQGFATGGFVTGPGGPRTDSILARLSNGEYVIPAHIVARMGVSFFDWLIGKTRTAGPQVGRPGDGSEGLAFADGGFVGRISSVWNTLTDPIGWVRSQVVDLIGKIPGGGALRDVVTGFARSALGTVIDAIREKVTDVFSGGYQGPVSERTAGIQQWIRQQDGKPYVWAGVGPGGYDCSGMVGAVYNLMRGRSPHSRVFTTHNQAPFFPGPGWGLLTAGWAHAGERGGGSVGHTAANLAGLGFESRGSDGVVVGRDATPVGDFARMGHAVYDSGGWLLPGLTVAYNGTGRPERILTGPDWDRIQARLSGGGGSAGSSTTYNIYPRVATLDERQLQGITAKHDMLSRIGRQE